MVIDTPMIQIVALYLDFKGEKNINVLFILFGALQDAGCFWFGFGILILIWIRSIVFDTPMIQILALYFDFEGAKNIHVL